MRFILIILIFFILNQKASATYEVTENCKTAWMLLMDLKIDDAKKLLAEEIKANPENYYVYYLDQTCDAYKLLINSSQEDYETFIENYYKKREIMDGKYEDSPYYLGCYSEMELQLGIFNIINGSRLSGLRKAYSGYKNVYRNLEKYPEFKPSLKLDGFFNVAISNIPPFVKWAASFFGVTADSEYGFNILNQNYVAQKNIKGLNAESALFVILTAKLNKTPEMVYDFTKSLDSNISHTFIHRYFKANIAHRTGRNEEALDVLQQIDISNHEFADLVYSYLMGKVLLRKLDYNSGYYLSRYLSGLKKKEYLKEINYQLALFHLVNNDDEKYFEYCKVVREEGKDINERDLEALYDARLDYDPDINLVKARLLLDGGYLNKFELSIKSYEVRNDGLMAHQIEYLFLKARFNASKKNNNEAIKLFLKVIEMGEDLDYYFASEAALRLGKIYEEMGEIQLAKDYFEISVNLYKSNYYEYIEDRAIKAYKNL